jgi:hypothetical protein
MKQLWDGCGLLRNVVKGHIGIDPAFKCNPIPLLRFPSSGYLAPASACACARLREVYVIGKLLDFG